MRHVRTSLGTAIATAVVALCAACSETSTIPITNPQGDAVSCQAGERHCNEGATAVQECNSDGNGWTDVETCPAGQSCSNAQCRSGDCQSQDHKSCHEGDSFWFDSCGNRETLAEACGGRPCVEGQCCQAKCQGRQCGDDGCGGSCGDCSGDQVCTQQGKCECEFAECGGACCAQSESCVHDQCCTPDCDGRQCGPDGCGGACPPNDCDDGSDCTTDSCDTDSGQCRYEAVADGSACDADADACTDDSCINGVCTVGSDLCVCDIPADCLAFEDGDLCNGTLICDEHRCVPDTATEVVCPPTEQSCRVNQCISATGLCALMPAENDSECDDGSLCTQDDVCRDGTCMGRPVDCDDDNPCTADLCNTSSGQCQHMPAAGGCDDGDPCTFNDTCFQGQCLGTRRECNDNNLCTEDFCDPGSGQCSFNLITCEDGDICTQDHCEPQIGCVFDPLFESQGGIGQECTEHCQCASHYCYDGPYMAPFRFCTKTNCNGEGGGCPDPETQACLIFTTSLIYDYELDYDSICQTRCFFDADCQGLSDQYAPCPGWTYWDGEGIGPPTCVINGN